MTRCTPEAYPESNMSPRQTVDVNALMFDADIQQHDFSGLYYPNNERESFETYFGLDIRDARYLFCYRAAPLQGGMYPIEYYEAWYNNQPYILPPSYVAANVYRNQLKACLSGPKGSKNGLPVRRQTRTSQVQTCDYQTGQGYMSILVTSKVTEWLSLGQPVYVETEDHAMCMQVTKANQISEIFGVITIATIECH
jgi:hypothetical protein